MDVNLNLIKYFITVIEAGNISKAAAQMGVRQPTVTYNIKQLERALNLVLFTVGRQGVIPEPCALALYQQIKTAYQELLTALHRFQR